MIASLTTEDQDWIKVNSINHTISEMGIKLGFTYDIVKQFIYKHKLSFKKVERKKKLTNEQIEFMRTNNKFYTSNQYAGMFKCSRLTINKYCHVHKIKVRNSRLKEVLTKEQITLVYALKDTMTDRQILKQPEFKGIQFHNLDSFAKTNDIVFKAKEVKHWKTEKYVAGKCFFNVDEYSNWVI
jgi:hypothetical protein